MKITGIPFSTTDWAEVAALQQAGERGHSVSRGREFGDIRVRVVEYSPGYVADHWCDKGHILYCLAGELQTDLQDGRQIVLGAGMSYQVADGEVPHRSRSRSGATLLIVD